MSPDIEEDRPDDEDSDDEDSVSTSTSTSTEDLLDSLTLEDGQTASKKKRRKKKKKKSEVNGSSPVAATAATLSGPARAEADKRFNTALEEIRSGEEMWVSLGAAGIAAAKTKKLMEALKTNSAVTSVDLNSNAIGEEGAAAIATVLSLGGAPQLISLDLRECNFTENALTILEGLSKIRKQLVVKTGPLKEPEPEVKEVALSGRGREITKGPMFRKYFQTADDDEPTQLTDAGTNPEELWAELHKLVDVGHRAIPGLMERLQHLAMLLQQELETIETTDMQQFDAMDGSRPHIKATLAKLPLLERVMAVVPRKVMLQHASEPHPAVGSHRVWACEVVALLLGPHNPVMDRMVASAKLAPRVVHLAMQHPLCSAAHARAIRVLRSSLESSSASDLLLPMLIGDGWGCGLAELGQGGRLSPPLLQQLAERGTEALGVLSGVRNPSLGLVLDVSKTLLAASEGDDKNTAIATIQRALLVSEPWSSFSGADGALPTLLREQEGDLGGPRAVRPPAEEGSELAEMAGGGLMSGHEILALLQGRNTL